MATAVASLYNTLPTLGDADDKFIHREATFEKLIGLFKKYDYEWGLCLVHVHCNLEAGELMLANGNISNPSEASVDSQHVFPERWLCNGKAYEFTTKHTRSPPVELVDEFRSLTGANPVLGLYYSGGQGTDDGLVSLERTEGRSNITDPVQFGDVPSNSIQTAWLPGSINPIQMACTIWCDMRTTRTSSSHKDTRTHRKD
ncbi:MAG: hypothetical protein M1820_000768 [Bogoriella megaspora]|nr:MAG: hypothetical protein M1820_000768 [Bogoriella megaspora]